MLLLFIFISAPLPDVDYVCVILFFLDVFIYVGLSLIQRFQCETENFETNLNRLTGRSVSQEKEMIRLVVISDRTGVALRVLHIIGNLLDRRRLLRRFRLGQPSQVGANAGNGPRIQPDHNAQHLLLRCR